MKEQIEEMAKVIKSSLDGLGHGSFNFTGEEISAMFAEALYNAGYRKQEWISVADRLPEKETKEVICYSEEIGIGIIDVTYLGMDWQRLVRDTIVTHWMPLPEPPKMKGGAE